MTSPMGPPDLDSAVDLFAFLDASPSPFHACETAAARLTAAGFVQVEESATWDAIDGGWFVIRDGSLVAGDGRRGRVPEAGFRIIGAHTDSPNLRIKPQPDAGRAGAGQLAVEIYGGVLLNSWLGRDLGLSGRLSLTDGTVRLVRIDRPLLHIPQLAIHLDREVTTVGLKLNPQQHLDPLWFVGPPEARAFRSFLAKEAEVDADAIAAWDVMVHDLTPGAVVGRADELLASSRLDNLCSAWAAVRALIEAMSAPVEVESSDACPVVVLFDHEEIGSNTNRGAGSPLLATVLERLVLARGGDREAYHRALAASVCVSADMAHATHPNYSEYHEPNHWIALNGGPVVKTNVNQRYATDARSAAVFLEACERADVPVQQYVHRNDLPCGSTIGPITASQLGIPTVDVGAPQLAMHSARELMGSADPAMYAAAMAAFLTPPPSGSH